MKKKKNMSSSVKEKTFTINNYIDEMSTVIQIASRVETGL